jgi:tetratricopeptide (TPR) repeat protein
MEHSFPFWIATGSIHLGLAEISKQSFESGIAQIASGLWLLEAAGALIVIPFQRTYLAEAYLRSGNVKDALELIDETIQGADSQIPLSVVPAAYRLRGDALALRGDHVGAEASYKQAMALAHDSGNRWLELRAAVSLITLHGGEGTADEIRRVLEPLVASFPIESMRPLVTVARELVAQV